MANDVENCAQGEDKTFLGRLTCSPIAMSCGAIAAGWLIGAKNVVASREELFPLPPNPTWVNHLNMFVTGVACAGLMATLSYASYKQFEKAVPLELYKSATVARHLVFGAFIAGTIGWSPSVVIGFKQAWWDFYGDARQKAGYVESAAPMLISENLAQEFNWQGDYLQTDTMPAQIPLGFGKVAQDKGAR